MCRASIVALLGFCSCSSALVELGIRTGLCPHLFVSLILTGEAFLLTLGAFSLTVELLCLQSLKALIRHTFAL